MPKILRVNPSKQAVKFTSRLPAKQQGQIAEKIRALCIEPFPHDSQQLRGNLSVYRRVTCGEYRIAYFINEDILHIVVIAKRNDDEIYRLLKMK